MRLSGTKSWQISVGTNMLIDCALWIRAVERLAVPADPLVPGPLDLERPPAPISTADESIAAEWLGWWHSLVDPAARGVPPGRMLEPAYDTPDPLGLAAYPLLAAIVTRRWQQASEWHHERQRKYIEAQLPPSPMISKQVAAFERALGRRVRPFTVEFVLIAVRDEVIREINPQRYLVPDKVYDGPNWAGWIRDLVARVGS
jgi:hypothetical protein